MVYKWKKREWGTKVLVSVSSIKKELRKKLYHVKNPLSFSLHLFVGASHFGGSFLENIKARSTYYCSAFIDSTRIQTILRLRREKGEKEPSR
jgi:hypothetical protein